eukprot:m.62473 g.62473  ORF g.62473 m.62473 type:complete len:125 (-) comp11509_c0_seq6:642-1016(-)
MCGRSRVAKGKDDPSIKLTVPLYLSNDCQLNWMYISGLRLNRAHVPSKAVFGKSVSGEANIRKKIFAQAMKYNVPVASLVKPEKSIFKTTPFLNSILIHNFPLSRPRFSPIRSVRNGPTVTNNE